ncbi:MAG TPA: alpha/beta hydrolase [Arthrobacter sp.]|jgi:hypothetical protein|nr:alpha/beta hydrolase [Arthrobacter sp.]
MGLPRAPWRVLPSWYLIATDDQMIPPAAQHAMSERAGSSVTEVAASHSVYVSQPQAVASLIKKAAGARRHTARRTYWQDPLVVRRNTNRWRLTHKEECNTATAAEVASSITLRLKTGAGGQRATATGLLGAPCDG